MAPRSPTGAGPAVALRGVTRRFGGLRAVDGLDLSAGPGEVLGLVGANGSGKSTTLDLIAGLIRPDAGRIALAGRDVTALPAAARARLGLARTFQHPRVFARMTLAANLRAAGADRDAALRALRTVGLAGRADALAGGLSHAERRGLELARAIAVGPAVLLLDEPASGLAPPEVAELRSVIAGLAAGGTAIVLVEHRIDLVADACTRVAVLEAGRRIADGPPDSVLAEGAVRRAWLGEAA